MAIPIININVSLVMANKMIDDHCTKNHYLYPSTITPHRHHCDHPNNHPPDWTHACCTKGFFFLNILVVVVVIHPLPLSRVNETIGHICSSKTHYLCIMYRRTISMCVYKYVMTGFAWNARQITHARGGPARCQGC